MGLEERASSLTGRNFLPRIRADRATLAYSASYDNVLFRFEAAVSPSEVYESG